MAKVDKGGDMVTNISLQIIDILGTPFTSVSKIPLGKIIRIKAVMLSKYFNKPL